MPDSSSDLVIDYGHRRASASRDVAALSTRLTQEYGLRHPFVGAGMGFIAHEQLAAAVTNAGGLGVLGASPDPPGSLPVMVERLRALTSGPFGVDLICAYTGFGPASTDWHIDVCVQLDVPLVVFHHDPPPARWISTLRAAGIRVWMQASSHELAAAAIELGVNGIVAQGSEAGGHARGHIPLHALLRTIRHKWPDMLLLGAGGISDGTAAVAALRAGADGVWVGTALVAAVEANAHPEYKRRLIDSPGKTLRTNAFGPEWPDQPYRLLATPVVRGADTSVGGTDAEKPGTIGRTRLFPHSVNTPYDIPARSALPPTPESAARADRNRQVCRRTIIEFQQHDGNQGETFDPRRTGFDHMGFKVDTRAALHEWLTRFEQFGVHHSPIAEREYGAVLTFKDPDGIQFEMFFKADHP